MDGHKMTQFFLKYSLMEFVNNKTYKKFVNIRVYIFQHYFDLCANIYNKSLYEEHIVKKHINTPMMENPNIFFNIQIKLSIYIKIIYMYL